MNDYQQIFDMIVADPRYLANLDWGQSRPGHPEGSIRAHIAELESNLEKLRGRFSETEAWKLRVLIHTHDTFKGEAEPGCSINHPASHASLARAFLARFCDDAELLDMVQFHDEHHALYQQVASKGKCNAERFEKLIAQIKDWNLFLAFLVIDGCTEGKDRKSLRWLFEQISGRVQTCLTVDDLL